MTILKPPSYSKLKDAKDLLEHLKACPHQCPNTREAVEGHVMEFIGFDHPQRGCATLWEFFLQTRDPWYQIWLEGGVVIVKAEADGFKSKGYFAPDRVPQCFLS